MLKIWAKTIVGEKITRDLIYKEFTKYNPDNFVDYLRDICHTLDIPTPVVLKNHSQNFERFNITRFKPGDFVENVDFELLVLENASE